MSPVGNTQLGRNRQDVKALSQTSDNSFQMTLSCRQDHLNATKHPEEWDMRSWIWGLKQFHHHVLTVHHMEAISSKSRSFFYSSPTCSMSLSQLAEVLRWWAVRDSWYQNGFSIRSWTFPRVSPGIGRLILGCHKSRRPTVSQVCTRWTPSLLILCYIWRKSPSVSEELAFSQLQDRNEGHQLHSCTSIPKYWIFAMNTTGCSSGSNISAIAARDYHHRSSQNPMLSFALILDRKPSSS